MAKPVSFMIRVVELLTALKIWIMSKKQLRNEIDTFHSLHLDKKQEIELGVFNNKVLCLNEKFSRCGLTAL